MPFSLLYGELTNDKPMDIETVRTYCLQKKAVSEGFPFDETTLVFKVVDRMFCVADLECAEWISLKCEPE